MHGHHSHGIPGYFGYYIASNSLRIDPQVKMMNVEQCLKLVTPLAMWPNSVYNIYTTKGSREAHALGADPLLLSLRKKSSPS